MLSLQTARFLLLTGWVLATMLAVPLAKLPYDVGWQHWTWLPPESVAARFYIWKYSADKTSAHMLTGIGIRGTRDLHLVIPVDPNDPNMGYALKGRAARHPHNVFLQTWLELGAIGAVLLLSIGLAGLWSLRNWPVLASSKRLRVIRRLLRDRSFWLRHVSNVASWCDSACLVFDGACQAAHRCIGRSRTPKFESRTRGLAVAVLYKIVNIGDAT